MCQYLYSPLEKYSPFGCVPLNARNAHAHNATITHSTNMSVAINGTSYRNQKSIMIETVAEVTVVSVIQILKNYSSSESDSSSDEKYKSLQEKKTC